MAGINEIPRNPSQVKGALYDGVEAVSETRPRQFKFKVYSRVILPLDGYVFWQPTVEIGATGSLHFAQEIVQNEDETLGYATVRFTSEKQITEFSSAIDSLFIASVDGFRYVFSQQLGFYEEAGLWHYFGHSVQPAMASQLLDTPGAIDPTRAVVSNSIPLWLALNNYATIYWDWFTNSVPIYPSELVTPNLVPPYAAVHIPQEATRALQAAPLLTRNRSHYQLAADSCRVTLYGLQSDEAEDFLDCVLQYSVNSANFGVMNMPIVRDGKRKQEELTAVAMQKFIDVDISYNQARVADVARQLITSVLPPTINAVSFA